MQESATALTGAHFVVWISNKSPAEPLEETISLLEVFYQYGFCDVSSVLGQMRSEATLGAGDYRTGGRHCAAIGEEEIDNPINLNI